MNNSSEPTFRSLLLQVATNVLSPPQTSNSHNSDNDEHDTRHERHDSFKGLIPLLKQTLFLLFLTGTLLATSIGLYGLFYWFVMPPKFATEPLFFDYGGGSRNGMTVEDIAREALRTEVEKSCWGCCEVENQEEKCCSAPPKRLASSSSPSSFITAVATANLMVPYTQWTPCTPDVTTTTATTKKSTKKTTKSEKKHILRPTKPHFIDIVLTLPESHINQQMGLFTVETSLHDTSGTTLAYSRRSSMLPYQSKIVEVIKKGFFLIVPYMLGMLQEEKIVVLECFNHFVESVDQPLALVQVKLSIPPSTTTASTSPLYTSSTPIQITSGQVRIGKELNMFQQFLKQWFFTSAFIGISIFFVIQWMSFWFVRFCWDEFWSVREERNRRREEEQQRRWEGRGGDEDGDAAEEEVIYGRNQEYHYDEDMEDDDQFVPLNEPDLVAEEEEDDDDASKEEEETDNDANGDDHDSDDDHDNDNHNDGGAGADSSDNQGGGSSGNNNDTTNNDNDKNSDGGGADGKGGGASTKKDAPVPSKSKKWFKKRHAGGIVDGDDKDNYAYQARTRSTELEDRYEEKKDDDCHYNHYYNDEKAYSATTDATTTHRYCNYDSGGNASFVSRENHTVGRTGTQQNNRASHSRKLNNLETDRRQQRSYKENQDLKHKMSTPKKTRKKRKTTRLEKEREKESKKKEALLAEAVMKGYIGPYEIFTGKSE